MPASSLRRAGAAALALALAAGLLAVLAPGEDERGPGPPGRSSPGGAPPAHPERVTLSPAPAGSGGAAAAASGPDEAPRGPAGAPVPATSGLRGRVRDAWSRGPVPRAELRLIAADDPTRQRVNDEIAAAPRGGWGRDRVVASDEGDYAFTHLPGGRYRLLVRAPTHRPAERALDLADGGDVSLDVDLDVGGAIHGVVVDGAGAPLAGVEVTARTPGRRADASARTGPDGRFALTGVASGTVELTAARAGYVPPEPRLVYLPPADARVEGLRLALAAGAALGGRVLDGRGIPQPGAHVFVFVAGVRRPVHVRSDGAGRFVVADQPGGRVRLLAHSEGRALATRAEVDLGWGEARAIDLVLSPAIQLTGRVQDTAGQTLSGLRMVATAVEGEVSREVTSGPGGTFAFPDLYTGAHRLEVWRGARRLRPDPDEVDVTASGVDLSLVASEGSALRGVLRHGDGRPASLAVVTIKAERYEADVRPVEGAFAFTGLGPGPAEVSARTFDGAELARRTVTIPSAGEVVVDLALDAAAFARGRVVGPDGPLAGVLVTAASAGESEDSGGATGRAALSGPSGEYDLGPFLPGVVQLVVVKGSQRYPLELRLRSGAQDVDLQVPAR